MRITFANYLFIAVFVIGLLVMFWTKKEGFMSFMGRSRCFDCDKQIAHECPSVLSRLDDTQPPLPKLGHP